MKKVVLFIFLSIYIFPATVLAGEKFPVFVSILPQKFFVQQIGADQVDVSVMVMPGANPAIYEPKPSQMKSLSKTRIYFSVGVPFEKRWLLKIASANPKMRIVATDAGIKKLEMQTHFHGHVKNESDHHEKLTESHDAHAHTGSDPHIWLSPSLVKIQAKTILNALILGVPSQTKFFTKNYKNFISTIDNLDRQIKNLFKDKKDMAFMVFHPSWGYFARDYHLRQLPIEIEGKNPKPAQVRNLISLARQKNIQVIFAQPQFSTRSATLIANEIKGRVIFADPLAENWLTNMQTVANKFKEVLK